MLRYLQVGSYGSYHRKIVVSCELTKEIHSGNASYNVSLCYANIKTHSFLTSRSGNTGRNLATIMLRGSWGVLIRYAKIFTYYLVIYGSYHSQIVVSRELTKEIISGNVS